MNGRDTMSLPLLLDHLRKTAALEQVSALVSWDQETMMPAKGSAQRAEQSGVVAAVIHAHKSDPRIPEWIGAIDWNKLGDKDRANVAQAQRAYEQATRIPPALAQEIARAASAGQVCWAEARQKRSFAYFIPALDKLVSLKREEAAYLANGEMSPYDALLDQFEPGARTADLVPLLESLREPLVSLRQQISEKPQPPALAGHYERQGQLSLARQVAEKLGYDFAAGRIDLSNHPFSSGTGDDCRITTRIDESDPLDCLYSTIHEVGHALYSQGLSDPFLPGADYCSMGVHESQSRLWENQIARSRPFAEWLFPAMKNIFPDMEIADADSFYRTVNRVEPGFIRTEADEVHYNLHVLMRFELERDLIAGKLETAGLEEAWNTLFAQYFGLRVEDVNKGVLQDIHWSVGLFGYFPTYSLGNIYSACLDEAINKAVPDRDKLVASGNTGPILDWLREKIHSKGRMLAAPELVCEAIGKPASAGPLIAYLKTKYGELYSL